MSINLLQDLIDSLEKGCQAMRQGDDPEGIQFFKAAGLRWLNWLENLSDKDISVDSLNSLVIYMHGLIKAFDARDTIRSADILEYKILPLLKALLEGGQCVDE